MDEDQILQSIIADPDVVDPTIDVSQLRQTTPTSSRLLGNVSGIQGLRFDPTRTDYLRDLYSIYGGGLPTIDVAPEVVAPVVDTTTPVVDTGGGGGQDQATQPFQDLVDPNVNIDEVALTGGQTDTPISDSGITVENIAQDQTPYDIPMDPSDLGASIENIIAKQNQTISDAPDVFDINEVGDTTPGVFDYESEAYGIEPSISTIVNPGIFDDYAGVNDPQIGDLGFQNYTPSFEPEQQNLVSQAFSKVGSTAENIMDDLSQIPGAIADFANQTVDIAGQKINVGKTLLSAGINKIAGGPISLVFDLISNIPPSVSQIEYEGYDQGQKNAIDNAYGPGGVMDGYNAVSAFGKGPLATVTERLETRTSNGIFDDTTDKLNDLSEKLGGVTINPPAYDFDDTTITRTTPAGNTVDVKTGDITNKDGINIGNINDEFNNDGDDKDDSPGTTNNGGFGDTEGQRGDPYGGGLGGVQIGLGSSDVGADGFDNDGGFGDTEGQRGDPYGGGLGGVQSGLGSSDVGTPTGISGPPSRGGTATTGPSGPPSQGGGGGSDSCFLAGTLITMADGTTKSVEQVDLGDEVAVGGKVFAVGRFLNTELYDYKGIKVSGSHMVNEDGVWMRVRNTKHGKSLGNDENTVYVFGSENRRILINGILFTDYFETKEQEKFVENEEDFFKNWKEFSNKHNENNVNTLNES